MTSDRLEEMLANRDREVTEEQASHDTLYSNTEAAVEYLRDEKGLSDDEIRETLGLSPDAPLPGEDDEGNGSEDPED